MWKAQRGCELCVGPMTPGGIQPLNPPLPLGRGNSTPSTFTLVSFDKYKVRADPIDPGEQNHSLFFFNSAYVL